MAELGNWEQADAPRAAPAPVRPRLSAADVALLLWRAKWVMMLVALPLLALGLLAALQMPKTYASSTGLYVRAGDEIKIVSALPGDDRGGAPDTEVIIQGELELIASRIVAERTLSRFSMKRLYPDIHDARQKALAAAPDGHAEAVEMKYFQKSVEAYQKHFHAYAAPNNPVINVSFRHKNPETATEVLNAALAAYLNYRAELFGARPTDRLTAQRKKTEGTLLEAEDAIRAFLTENNIGDFASERATAQGLFATISGELSTVRSRASAVDGQVAKTRAQLAATSPDQDLFIEDSSDQTLMNLKVEREQLLSRYTPDSRAVQNIDRQIAQVEAYLESQSGPSGLVRSGPNPTYQALEAALNTAEAEAESLALQRAELEGQLAQISAKLNRFTALEPQWNEVVRNRDLLEANVRTLAERAQQRGTIDGMTGEEAESVTVIEPARVPLRGKSLRRPIALLAVMFAGFSGLMAGLIWVFTRRGFATPASLQRTTGLPVIGAVRPAR